MIRNEGNTFSIRAEILVDAPIEEAWASFMDPAKSAEFFFGISFVSDLKVGSPITWSGVWEGKAFEDRGTVLEIRAPRLFRYDYFSAMSGKSDLPENHYEVSYSFDPVPGGVLVAIGQSNAGTRESAEHSEQNWNKMLAAVKEKLEKR
jgi:uncharacterized protein YndB with AHSA1/START domain